MPTVVQDVSGDTALQNAIAALKAKIEGAEESSDIAQLVSKIGELKENLNNIENDLDDLMTTYKSANLFDKTNTINGYYFYPRPSDSSYDTGDLIAYNGASCAYVPINGVGDYSMLNLTVSVGTFYGKNVVLFDENKDYVALVIGTLDASDNTITHFAITQEHIDSGAVYMGYSLKTEVVNTAMCVKSDTYPSEYIEYYEYNALNGYIPRENVVGLPAYVESLISPVEELAENTSVDVQLVDEFVKSLVHEEIGENLFDKNAVISGSYFDINGSRAYAGIGSDSSMNIAYVPINGVGNYSCKVASDFYGTYKSKFIPIFDKYKENIGVVTGALDANDNTICYFSITDANLTVGAVYIGYSVKNPVLDTAMIVKSDTYPSEYIPYTNTGMMFLGNIERTHVVDLVDTHEKTANLFNYDDVTFGYYFNVSGSGEYSGLNTSGNSFVSYIPIVGAGDYSWKNAKEIYGTYIIRYVPVFDANKNYLFTITGTIDQSDNSITHFTVTDEHITQGAVYFGYTIRCTEIGQAMCVKSSTYPSTYIPYSDEYDALDPSLMILPGSLADNSGNVLYHKKVVFDGDSICQDGAVGGWAKIIGNRNKMYWQNAGVAGGTITAETYAGSTARHWVSRSIDDIYSEFPTLDYLILEGGTNDADTLTDDQIGAIDYTNWSTFDDTTFIGALESLFYKATNYYPTAKIGFIVAQKMGIDANARYDAGDSPSTRRRKKFFDLAMQVCEKWGIPYIDLWDGSPLCPKLPCYYDSSMTAEENTEAGKAYIDGQHLTPVGYSIISPKIEAWMKTL